MGGITPKKVAGGNLDAECGKGWVGTKPPGCKRAKKGETSAKSKASKAPSKTIAPKQKANVVPSANDAALKKRKTEISKVAKDTYQAEDYKGGATALVRDAESTMQKVLKDADVMIRIPSATTLEKIIDTGRFKTLFETGKSGGGKTDRKLRGHTEKQLFGYDDKSDPATRPIYGYMGDRNDEDGNGPDLKFYGGVSIRLKPSVRSRTTVTGGDSLADDLNDNDAFLPSRLDKPSISSFLKKRDLDAAGDKLEGMAYAKSFADVRAVSGQYVEAQVHGGLSVADIAEVAFLKGKPSQKVKQWAQQNNVRLVDKNGKDVK